MEAKQQVHIHFFSHPQIQIQTLTETNERITFDFQQSEQKYKHQIDVLEHSISSLQDNISQLRARHASVY